jgi:hypothetical protein
VKKRAGMQDKGVRDAKRGLAGVEGKAGKACVEVERTGREGPCRALDG